MNTFNWLDLNGDLIDDYYQYFAIDNNGEGYVHSKHPVIAKEQYWQHTLNYEARYVGMFNPLNWKSSLIQRYTYVNSELDNTKVQIAIAYLEANGYIVIKPTE